MTRVRLLLLPALALAVLVAAACGGGDDGSDAATTQTATTSETAATTAETGATASAETAADVIDPRASELASLVEAWYAKADPAVCERMTNRMLEFGWKRKGNAGVRACKRAVEAASPAPGAEVVAATIDGETAEVSVRYELDDSPARDVVRFVRRGGEWKIDAVAGGIAEPEA